MTEQPKNDRVLPRGVYVLALLMFLCGGVLLLAALVLPFLGARVTGAAMVPWYIYLIYSAYFLVVGWGLWGGKRWAYLAMLLMCVVLAFYQFRTAIILQQNVLVPFLVLLVIFGYLIRPNVRAAFLRPGGTTSQ